MVNGQQSGATVLRWHGERTWLQKTLILRILHRVFHMHGCSFGVGQTVQSTEDAQRPDEAEKMLYFGCKNEAVGLLMFLNACTTGM